MQLYLNFIQRKLTLTLTWIQPTRKLFELFFQLNLLVGSNLIEKSVSLYNRNQEIEQHFLISEFSEH
jgi:hypothetical protein